MGSTLFRPDRMNLIGALVMFLICLILVGHKPLYFVWVLLLPIIFAIWVLRTRTEVNDKGLTTYYLLRKSQHVSWNDFHAVRFSRGGKAYAVVREPGQSAADVATKEAEATKNAAPSYEGGAMTPAQRREREAQKVASAPTTKPRKVLLPGISFNDLTRLSEASGGRIPDPISASKASEPTLTTISRDGYAVVTDDPDKIHEANVRAIQAELDRRRQATDESRPTTTDSTRAKNDDPNADNAAPPQQ